MIQIQCAKKYCRGDISLIENYEQAINDKKQTWDCHHRLETDLGLSRPELIKQGRYLNVPASELIFLTHAEHTKLHNLTNHHDVSGEKNPMYGKKPEDYMSEEAIKEKHKKQSENLKGEKNGMHGTHPAWMNNGVRECRPKTPEEIERYHKLGYTFGRKLNKRKE